MSLAELTGSGRCQQAREPSCDILTRQMGRYLIEIRTGGELTQRLREITYDVAEEFDLRGAVDPRLVPHITLCGPYDTDRGYELKRRLLDTLDEYSVVPYRIDGFDTFPDTEVVYAKVVPSHELRALRRAVSRRLRPVCGGYPSDDTDYWCDFHITVAFRDVGSQFDAIRRHVRDSYELSVDAYATRVTSLDRRSIMYEYDLPRGEVLSADAATTADAWRATETALDELSAPDDHGHLAPAPGRARRTLARWRARLSGDR